MKTFEFIYRGFVYLIEAENEIEAAKKFREAIES